MIAFCYAAENALEYTLHLSCLTSHHRNRYFRQCGFLKIGILVIVVGAGFVALTGTLQQGVECPGNFDSWERILAGSKTGPLRV
ncbi:hypothetical protein BDZ97DRAFT_1827351 [Flammula alnicola]|nr:hypothetical protein BDZ97DRAFT_1827351 [Flammula alnicola]